MRVMLLCPGRGSYQKAQLGSLQGPSAVIDWLDAYRASLGRPTIREMDAAKRFSGKLHVAGENASVTTFGASLADIERIDPDKADIVCVGGNSMGWYTALFAAGALDLPSAARLVETMGSWQAGNVVGGQILYPVAGDDWTLDEGLVNAVESALRLDGVHLSIRLGGTAVLAGETDAIRGLLADMPKAKRGEREFPIQLPLHSAFHTPCMQGTSDRARVELADLVFTSPAVSLVDGASRVHRPFADPQVLSDWTLGAQVTDTFDVTGCIQTAMGDFAPDALVLPGPGDTLGAPVAQALIDCGWRGLRDKQDFFDAQSSESPVVISMTRPEQRALVT